MASLELSTAQAPLFLTRPLTARDGSLKYLSSLYRLAQVAELVDAHGSGPCAARCGGSSPLLGTKDSGSQEISKNPVKLLALGVFCFSRFKRSGDIKRSSTTTGAHAERRCARIHRTEFGSPHLLDLVGKKRADKVTASAPYCSSASKQHCLLGAHGEHPPTCETRQCLPLSI